MAGDPSPQCAHWGPPLRGEAETGMGIPKCRPPPRGGVEIQKLRPQPQPLELPLLEEPNRA